MLVTAPDARKNGTAPRGGAPDANAVPGPRNDLGSETDSKIIEVRGRSQIP
jgi:hypothetical protein